MLIFPNSMAAVLDSGCENIVTQPANHTATVTSVCLSLTSLTVEIMMKMAQNRITAVPVAVVG